MQPIAIEELLSRYDAFLLDAYGVLVNSAGALPGAAAFLECLRKADKRFLIVSNDASRSPHTALARYRSFGLDLALEQILTSGLLLRDHFDRHHLGGARCIVLGTEDSAAYVREAGGEVAAFDDATASVVVVADDAGYPFLEASNQVLTVLLARLEREQPITLLLPNPDLVFPAKAGGFGFAAGSIAAMFEAALSLRDPERALRFTALGKPHRPMFDAALDRLSGIDRRRVVMVGDQLGTDIAGAERAGLDSVLVTTGVARLSEVRKSEVQPTFALAGLVPD